MYNYQGEMPLGNPEDKKERSFFDDVSTSWDITNLSFGDGVDVASRSGVFEQYADYGDNEDFYKAYADTDVWYRSSHGDKIQRHAIEKALDEGKFILDADGNVAPGENATPISMYMYDNDAIKGGLLARRNGWDKKASDQAYIDETAKQTKALATKAEGSGLGARVTGTLAGYMFRQETAMEVAASPAKIVGSTILKGMGKAFVTEFAIGLFGETLRETQIREHMDKANLDYTLWDSTKNILIGAGLAGSIRGIGSGVVDANILRKVDSAGLDATDKEILNRFFRREQYKLTTNSRSNIELLHRVEDDINSGKTVDVSQHTDIDINTKTDDAIEENSMPDIIAEENIPINQQVDELHKEIDEIKPTEIKDDDIYDGMATPKDGDDLIEEMGEFDPEIKAEMESIQRELTDRQQQMKEASEPKIGGSEDEAKDAVKQMFKKTDDKYKSMNNADIAEQDRMYAEQLDMEANAVFAKFGDNLAAGTVAGVGEDENGNITFDPEMFVAGLGGYTALKTIMKSPTVKKELKGFFERMFDELETNPQFNAIVGKQQIVSDRLTRVTKKHFPELDTADLDADDILYFNKAARLIDNMRVKKKDSVLTKEERKAIKDSTGSSPEQILHDLFYDVAEIDGEIGKHSKLTDKPKGTK